MSFKTILIIAITALVTVILMNNGDEVNFWIFGIVRISKLAILGVMFVLGFIVGAMSFRRAKKKTAIPYQEKDIIEPHRPPSNLSDEDRDYIK